MQHVEAVFGRVRVRSGCGRLGIGLRPQDVTVDRVGAARPRRVQAGGEACGRRIDHAVGYATAVVVAEIEVDLAELAKLRVPITYATCRYSWSSPPARSRRRTRNSSRSITLSGRGRVGAAWSRDRCGRCPL
jgi:hypothetical protein